MSDFTSKAKTSSVYALVGTFSQQAANVLVTWMLIKNLSLKEFGIYNLLLATSTYLGIITSLGLISAFRRYLPEFFQKKEYSHFYLTVKYSLTFRTVATILTILVIIATFNKVGPFFQIDGYLNYFVIFAIGVVFQLQAMMLQAALNAMFLHKYAVSAVVAQTIIRLILLSVIFYLDYGLMEVLFVDLISFVILLILLWYFYQSQNIRRKSKSQLNQRDAQSSTFKRVARYSGFSIFNEAGRIFLDISTGFFVISHFLGPQILGYYAFAARIGRLISKWLPSRLMRTVVSPVFFARYAESGDKKELNRMFHFLTKLNAFIMFPVFTLLIVLGKEIIEYVFDPKYLVGYPVMLILLIHYLMRVFPVAMPLEAVEKPEMIMIAKIWSIYNLIMAIVLIQFWGIMGVAIAAVSATIFKKIFEYNMSKKYAEISFPWLDLFKILFNCALLTIFLLLTKNFITNAVSLVFICLIAGIAYLSIAYLNKAFLPDERNFINRMIGRPCFVF